MNRKVYQTEQQAQYDINQIYLTGHVCLYNVYNANKKGEKRIGE